MDQASTRPWISSYADAVPESIDLPTGNLYDLLTDSVDAYPDHIALEFFGRETTYRELGDQVLAAAAGLAALGVGHGDPVAIVLPNCPQHVIAFYAVLRLGAIVVEHNPLYTARELRHQFEDHAARTVIAWDKIVPMIQELPADVVVDRILSVDVTRAMPLRTRFALRLPVKKARESRAALTGRVSNTVRFEDLVRSPALDPATPAPAASDVALIQYTSGTTGAPKGAVLTHLNLGANAAQARAWVPEIDRGAAVVYAVLPMFHAYGLTLCLTFAMSMGARLVLFPKFDPELVLRVIRKHPPTFLPAVPPIYERLRKAAEEQKVSLAGIRIAISGAMPLSTAIVEPWEKLSGGYLVEGYGLSETSPVLMANPVAGNRVPGTVGLPLPGTDVRIVDRADPTVECATGDPGELVVRGPQVFSGYWRRPEESDAAFLTDADGARWFRTGDVATVDAAGFVRIVDRIKELVITGGFNVSPSEVEDVIRGMEGVEDVAIVGVPSEHSGEDVVAAVVLAADSTVDETAVRSFARQNLAAYKVPKRVSIVDELPKSLIGKVLRRQVRDQFLR